LNFERALRHRLQLVGARAQILFIRALLDLLGGRGYLLCVPTVGARQATVLRFKKQVGSAGRTVVSMYLFLRSLLRRHLHNL
jgi:hypothetical protein